MHPHALGGVGGADGAHQAHHGMLVGGVDGIKGHGHESGHAGRGDDRSPAGADNCGTGGGDAIDDPVEVDSHGLAVGLRVKIVAHAAPGGHAGIEMGQMEPAELGYGECHCSGAVRGFAHVGVDKAAPELLGHLGAAAVVNVRQDDVSALSGQMAGHGLTDAVASTGDQCHFPVHVHGP